MAITWASQEVPKPVCPLCGKKFNLYASAMSNRNTIHSCGGRVVAYGAIWIDREKEIATYCFYDMTTMKPLGMPLAPLSDDDAAKLRKHWEFNWRN